MSIFKRKEKYVSFQTESFVYSIGDDQLQRLLKFLHENDYFKGFARSDDNSYADSQYLHGISATFTDGSRLERIARQHTEMSAILYTVWQAIEKKKTEV